MKIKATSSVHVVVLPAHGGSWDSYSRYCRITRRHEWNHSTRDNWLSFRITL